MAPGVFVEALMLGRFFDFLFSLHDVHIGSGTRFTFVALPPALVFVMAALLAVLGYLTYVPQSASPAKKKWMGIFRGLLLAVVLMLACRPQLVMEHEDRQRSVVAVWVDSSASMTMTDPYTGDKTDPHMRDYLKTVGEELKAAGTQPASGDRVDRFELATATLADAKWLRELTDTQDVVFFTGSGRAEPVGTAGTPADVDARIAQIKAHAVTGDTTDVPTVVSDILDKVQGRRLSAIVLLTDGQTTAQGSRLDQSADKAQLAGTKVFAIPVGQEEEPFDLKITTPRVPESTFSRDPVSARIHVIGTGITQKTPVRVSVYRKPPGGGAIDLSAPLATKDLTLSPEQKELDTDLPIRLKKTAEGKSERFDLVARVDQAPGGVQLEERDMKNNEQTATVTVLDVQINALYVEGYPRWEFRYLKNELIREPTVNVSTLLLSADAEEGFVQDADPEVTDKVTGEEIFPGPLNHFPDSAADLDKYQVLLIGDVEPTYFSPLQQKLIVNWVRQKGGGVCFIAGNQYNPEAYRETDLEVLLPVTPDEIDPRARILPQSDNTPFNLQLTAAGKETNLFRFFDDPEESWKQVGDLPPMYWYKPVQGLKPGAIVLAQNPKRSLGGSPAPMLVQRQYGAGRVLFSAYDDTWRWRRYTGEPLFQSYWLQLCRLLYANRALNRRLDLSLESKNVEIGQQIKAYVTVRDPTLNGQLPAEIPALVVDDQGRTVQTITLAHPPGAAPTTGPNSDVLETLEGSATALQIGGYKVIIKPGTLPLDVQGADLTIVQPQREFETVTADMQSLRSVAARTEGSVVLPYKSDEILKEIPDRSVPILQAASEELWSKPFALVLVVLLAATEWLIRKSAGLI